LINRYDKVFLQVIQNLCHINHKITNLLFSGDILPFNKTCRAVLPGKTKPERPAFDKFVENHPLLSVISAFTCSPESESVMTDLIFSLYIIELTA